MCDLQIRYAPLKEQITTHLNIHHFISISVIFSKIGNVERSSTSPASIKYRQPWGYERVQPINLQGYKRWDIFQRYSDVIISVMASQITGVSSVYSTVCSSLDLRKHQSPTSLAFVRGIHRWLVNSPHKGPVTRKMFPFGAVIMNAVYKVQTLTRDQITRELGSHFDRQISEFHLKLKLCVENIAKMSIDMYSRIHQCACRWSGARVTKKFPCYNPSLVNKDVQPWHLIG